MKFICASHYVISKNKDVLSLVSVSIPDYVLCFREKMYDTNKFLNVANSHLVKNILKSRQCVASLEVQFLIDV